MSSRLIHPVSKFTRSLSTTASIGRPSHLLNNGAAKAASSAGGRKRHSPIVADEPAVDPSSRQHSTSTSTTTTSTSPHRPVTPRPRTIPFMQTFHHSAPKPAPAMAATAAVVLPDMALLEAYDTGADAPLVPRMPLLPDTRLPPPEGSPFRVPEAADAPLPAPEIVVVASSPALEPPAALTEVEGMGVDGVELGFAHALGREDEAAESFEMGPGMIRDLWKGMVEDVFGGGQRGGSSSSGASGAGPAAAA